jgi:arsenate reductase (thioredoxin)
MALDPALEKRMKQAEAEVAREFGSLDPEVVHREFTRVSDDLLRNARVMDFVPVLVHRHVRDNLKSVATAPSAVATS